MGNAGREVGSTQVHHSATYNGLGTYIGMLISKEATTEKVLSCTDCRHTGVGGHGTLPNPITVAITSVNTYMTLSTPSGMPTSSPELMDSKSEG